MNVRQAKEVCLFVLLFVCSAATISYGQDGTAEQAANLMRTGKLAEAETLWRELAQRFPQNASILAGLGVALAQQGKLQPAAEEYRRSLPLDPHQADVELDLALAEFRHAPFTASTPALKPALLAKPDDGRVILLL